MNGRVDFNGSTQLNVVIVVLLFLTGSCGFASEMDLDDERQLSESHMNIKLKSPEFGYGDSIPARYTCDGDNISPPLTWSDLPSGTKALALIMSDPDAPGGIWDHWVFYDLPAEKMDLAEDMPPGDLISGGGSQGRNSWKELGYGGPCPPQGTHRYFFQLFALDQAVGLKPGAAAIELREAMEGHILDQGQLLALYSR